MSKLSAQDSETTEIRRFNVRPKTIRRELGFVGIRLNGRGNRIRWRKRTKQLNQALIIRVDVSVAIP
jgi:hypothetical protein